jgi:hypothetical protein
MPYIYMELLVKPEILTFVSIIKSSPYSPRQQEKG